MNIITLQFHVNTSLRAYKNIFSIYWVENGVKISQVYEWNRKYKASTELTHASSKHIQETQDNDY
jgi:hypothetical protein